MKSRPRSTQSDIVAINGLCPWACQPTTRGHPIARFSQTTSAPRPVHTVRHVRPSCSLLNTSFAVEIVDKQLPTAAAEPPGSVCIYLCARARVCMCVCVRVCALACVCMCVLWLHNTTQHNTTQHDTTQYSTTQHKTQHTTPHHTTPHHNAPHHTTPQCTTPHHTTPHHTTTHHTTPHHTTPHHTTPHHTTPQHNATQHIMASQ